MGNSNLSITQQLIDLLYEICRQNWRVTRIGFYTHQDEEEEFCFCSTELLNRKCSLREMLERISISNQIAKKRKQLNIRELSFVELLNQEQQAMFELWNQKNEVKLISVVKKLP